MPGKVKIRCGRCRRIHQEVTEATYLRYPQGRRPCKVTRSAPWQPPPELSPEVVASFPPGTRILETAPGQGGRLRYECHKRCRKSYPVTFANYTRAVEAKLAAGGGELLLGVDLG